MSRLIPGQLVLSRAGRDQGRYFLVLKVFSDGYLNLVDGLLRRVEKPKRKKVIHVKGLELTVKGMLNADPRTWTNAQVAAAIETLLGAKPDENDSIAGGGVDPWPKQIQLK